MAITLRNDAKRQIMKILREQGYPSYARLVDLFDIYLTDDPNVIGYMIPGKAKIVLNQELSINQVSTIIRHEILHEYFNHAARQKGFEASNTALGSNHELANIAMDYEISNRGYTEADKVTARSIILGDKVLQGLVTEDQYPGWETKTFEEMYSELLKQLQNDKEALQNLLNQLKDISQKELDDLDQELSDAANQSETPTDDDQSNQNSKPSSHLQRVSQELQDKLDDVQDKVAELDSKSPDDEPFDSSKEQKEKADLAKRVAEIKRIFQDEQAKDEIINDTQSVKAKEKAAKAAKDIERYNNSPLQKFKLSLNRFIADQLSSEEEDTYTRIHPSYEDSEFIRPGRLEKEEKQIPLINVYFDVSVSFSDPRKTEGARKAIATLNQYVRSGDIEIDVYYFADHVSDNEKDAGGGTRGKPIQEHIKQTKPNNVIIITDSDINDCYSTTTVPGAVWFLFYDNESINVKTHIRGKKQTRSYLIRNY